MIHPFKHERAVSLDHALAAMSEGAIPYAGGTELLAAMKAGLLAPDHIIDLKGLAELHRVEWRQGTCLVAAATPHAVVAAADELQARLPMLAQVTKNVANPRVRWQGTIGGNLCFAEPRSDLIPALIALDAVVHLRSPQGTRLVALDEFITGPLSTARDDHELLTTVEIRSEDIIFQAYQRVQHLERPTVGVALVGRRAGWRLVVGAAGYLPVWREADGPDAFDVEAIADAVEPIEDAAGDAEYKRHLVRILAARALASASEGGA